MKLIRSAALFLCFISIALAQPAPPPIEPQAPAAALGVVGGRNNSYSDRIPAEQLVELDAAGDKFGARHIPDLSGDARGAVIILHDSAQHPAWPLTVAALSDELPLKGWDTLSIELPAPATAAPADGAAPPAPSAAPAAAPAVGAAAAGTEAKAQARIAAALKYYVDAEKKNVVLIGFGSGSIRAAEFLRQYAAGKAGNFEPIGALVLAMPLQQLNGIDAELPKILPATAAPTLELILDNDAQARAEAEARRRAVLHQRERQYRQLHLPPLNTSSDPQHSLMVKRLRAWLQKNAMTPAADAT